MNASSFLRVAFCGLILGVAPLVAADSAPAKPTASAIVGSWSGKDEDGATGTFVFAADGSADMIVGGQSLKETVIKDQGTITYRFDPAVKPMALDITMARTGGATRTLRCIVEFLSPVKIKMRKPNGEERPKDFAGPATEMIVLDKAETPKK